MKKFLLLTVFGLWLIFNLHAQNTTYRNGVTIKYVSQDYYSPLDDNVNLFDFENLTPGIELGYIRNVNEWLNVAVPMKFGVYEIYDENSLQQTDERIFLSFDGLLHFHMFEKDGPIVPYALLGAGARFDDENELEIHYPIGGGLNFKLDEGIYIQGETQYRFHSGASEQLEGWHHSLGLLLLVDAGKEEPPADADGDGIADEVDDCPLEPGVAAFNGCPDTDGDGIADKDDDCPEEAGSLEFNGCPDADGDGLIDKEDDCPTEAGPLATNGCPDRDGDGIADKDDECPDEAGLAQYNGCPPPPSDVDNDGIPDDEDDCPTTPGLAQYKGCPDTDGDGVRDPDDLCPTNPGPASNQGCPEMEKEEKEKLVFATQSVEFETNSARLKAASYARLDDIVDLMRKYTDYKLDIGGHTDSQGRSEYNQQLSEKRAKACYDYLVSKGISEDRMTFVGYGEERPVATNDTAEGRRQNRRVEFDMHL